MSLNKKLQPGSTALSLLCSETVVLTAPVVAGALLTNNLSSLWFLWSAAITGVVGWVFFARLWPRLPLQVENEFLRFRYGGKGSKLLLYFRSVLISFIIVPFFISWLILSAQRILQELFGLDSIFTTGVILAIPLMLIPVNNIFDRVRQDSFFFLIIALALFSATIILFIDYNPGETVAMLKRNGISSKAFEFPSAIGNDLWFYLLVFWWIAYLPDLPDLDGQKLMKTTEPRFAVSTVGFFRIGSLIIQIPLIYLAFVAASRSLQGDNGEQSIYQFLSASSNFTLRFLFGVAWLLAIGVIIMNKIRWGADVISVIVGKWKMQIEEKKGEQILVTPSIMIYLISILLWTQTTNIRESIGLLVGIGVGVAPVYFLRWFWWRINSWAQLSAMVAAIIYEIGIRVALIYSSEANALLNEVAITLRLSPRNAEYLILGILVTLTWIIVMLLTPPESEEVLTRFESTVKPGGLWGKNRAGDFKLLRRVPAFLFLALGVVLIQALMIDGYTLSAFNLFVSVLLSIVLIAFGSILLNRDK